MTAVALTALLGLRSMGILAPVNVGVLIAITIAALASTVIILYWKKARVLPIGLRVGIQVIGITCVIYATGWGPVLSVGFVFCAAQAVAIEGSPAVFPAMMWSLVCLAGAEVAVGVGWAPSVLSPGRSHGIAILMAAGLVFVMRIVWVSARDRELAAAALSESEDRLRRLLVNAADAVVVLDRSGSIVFATEAIESLTGYTVDELVGRGDASSIVHPDDLAHLREGRNRKLLAEDGASLRADMRVQHRDGSLRWCQISAMNQLDDPVLEGIVINVHDITDRREAAAQRGRGRSTLSDPRTARGRRHHHLRPRRALPVRELVVRAAHRPEPRDTRRAGRAAVRASRRRGGYRRGVGAHARASGRDDTCPRARAARRRPLALAGELDLQPARRPDHQRDHLQRARRERPQSTRRSPGRGVADPRDDRVGRAPGDRARSRRGTDRGVHRGALLPRAGTRRRRPARRRRSGLPAG